jgi:hypothetical protein
MANTQAAALVALALALAGCDGPQEQAGEKQDAAAGVVESEDSIRSGPAETMGERADEAAASARKAADAQADALEDQADAARDAADKRAEALEQEAERVRGR